MNGVNKPVPSGKTAFEPEWVLPRAVIFDMDGTLVATTEADFLAWQKLFREHGRDLGFADYFPLLGRKSIDVVTHILGMEGTAAEEAMHRKMEHFAAIAQEKGIDIIPHAEEFLQQMRALDIPLALATSSRKMKMQLVMEESGLDKYFSVFVTGEEVQKGKPDPGIFLLAANRLGVDPAQCLVLEDAANGVKAAKAAGMKCIAITSTHSENDLSQADLVIHHFSDISPQGISTLFL